MCGVFGVWGVPEASRITYLGLHGLQHRGQESAGIVTADGEQLYSFKRMGRVADIFDEDALNALPGTGAIGHVRYSTQGMSILKNTQPFAVEFSGTSLAVAHNGNLTNAGELRRELEAAGSLFHSTMDTEVFVHLLARAEGTLVERLQAVLPRVQGAYSLLLLTPHQLIAARDPHGFRPLVLGRSSQGGTVVASESSALRLVDANPEREVEPGEIVVVDGDGQRSTSLRATADEATPPAITQCIFEHIYFARPDSHIFGERVYQVRKAIGRRLAIERPVEHADVVIPVPDSGTAAAIGYAQEAGLPYEMGLIRSHYAGRTFIEPSSSIRHFGVKLKLSPVEHVIAGKVVVVVDDSIVRGTTSKKIVRLLRENGAREVHMRIACPPTTHSCFYGIDTPDRSELIASTHSVEAIAEFLDADSLAYLSIDGLHGSVGTDAGAPVARRAGYCDACFTGNYPVPVSPIRFQNHLTERD